MTRTLLSPARSPLAPRCWVPGQGNRSVPLRLPRPLPGRRYSGRKSWEKQAAELREHRAAFISGGFINNSISLKMTDSGKKKTACAKQERLPATTNAAGRLCTTHGSGRAPDFLAPGRGAGAHQARGGAAAGGDWVSPSPPRCRWVGAAQEQPSLPAPSLLGQWMGCCGMGQWMGCCRAGRVARPAPLAAAALSRQCGNPAIGSAHG